MDQKTRTLFLALALIALLLTGCRQAVNNDNGEDGGNSGAVNQAADTSSPAVQRVFAAEQTWLAQDIHSYSMEIRHSRPNWSMQVIQLTVERGEITKSSFSCFPETNCILQRLEPDDFTLPQLFDIARDVAPVRDMNVQLTFHERFGYPTAITHDEGVWIVRNFQILD